MISNSELVNLANNEIYSNKVSIQLRYIKNFVSFISDHFYNNGEDLHLGNVNNFNLNGVVFDNPKGNFQNYTNLYIYIASSS